MRVCVRKYQVDFDKQTMHNKTTNFTVQVRFIVLVYCLKSRSFYAIDIFCLHRAIHKRIPDIYRIRHLHEILLLLFWNFF